MQLELDFSRCARAAARNHDALASLGAAEVMRAVIWLMQLHPKARSEGGEIVLSVTYEQAGQWLREQTPFRGMALGRSSVRKAVAAWWRLGVMTAAQGRPTLLRLNKGRLVAWFNAEEARQQQSLAAWLDPRPEFVSDVSNVSVVSDVSVVSVVSDVSNVSVVSASKRERESKELESLSLSESGPAGHNGHAGHEPAGSPGAARPAAPLAPLPELPEEVMQVTGLALLRVLHAWWQREGVGGLGYDADHVIGAVLAAHWSKPDHPQRYIQACLERGVESIWINKARAFREQRRPAATPYAPHGQPR